ncbi:flagellar biosynthesis anti-sigma factor FlgM [Sporolactobacillus pectinivorans]|uniref:flagellar biosynthesis anti-sigma factor FlgM n=1 Tax=Sporolactobacillus pectinivorans TaxID=1591408 RepID=UPI000C25B8CA|nr:flagellar biosynthesis anti-sigma factor FlgM [Sporolactobacillus pectinivorans]
MKIDGYQPVQPYANYSQPKSADQPQNVTAKSDKVEISSAAKRLQGAQKFEDARSEKVQQIKSQVNAGTYNVSSEDIAKKVYAYWNNF